MFIVLEIQTQNGSTAVITNTYSDEQVAYQKFYQILSFAAVSEIDIHTAIILNEQGVTIRNGEVFIHNISQ